ncbi:MAG: hypothetical protein ACK40V_09980 [Anaerolineales bacterium]
MSNGYLRVHSIAAGQRKKLAAKGFKAAAHYDTIISGYLQTYD